jgi:chemotaxis protein histidine kinase CheA
MVTTIFSPREGLRPLLFLVPPLSLRPMNHLKTFVVCLTLSCVGLAGCSVDRREDPPSKKASAKTEKNDDKKSEETAQTEPAKEEPKEAPAAEVKPEVPAVVETKVSEVEPKKEEPKTLNAMFADGLFNDKTFVVGGKPATPEGASDLQKKIFKAAGLAALKSDRAILLALANNPKLLEERSPIDGSFYHLMAEQDRYDVLRLLMQQDVNLDRNHLFDKFHRQPSWYAQSTAMLKVLVNLDDEIYSRIPAQYQRNIHYDLFTSTDSNQQNALHHYAESGKDDLVRFVVGRYCHTSFFTGWEDSVFGTPLNAQDFNQRTPLHYAVISNNAVSVLNLVSCRSVKVAALDNYKRTPLHYAAALPDFKVGIALLTSANLGSRTKVTSTVDWKDTAEETQLHIATRCGNKEAASILQNYYGADRTLLDQGGRPAGVFIDSCADFK